MESSSLFGWGQAGTGTTLIYFLEHEPQVLHKSQKPPKTVLGSPLNHGSLTGDFLNFLKKTAQTCFGQPLEPRLSDQ